MIRKGVFSAALVCVVGVALQASAQDGDQGADLGGAILLDEITIRGDKIDRTLGEATAGTTVIDGEEASAPKNRDIDDVVNREANVLSTEGFSLPSIRGIDSTSGARPGITVGSQPRTPILVDDVATPSGDSSTISQVSTWDLGSVEVTRGPQPTSTGRNAFGGAIRVYTNDPSFELEGAARLGFFSQDGTGTGAFMVNVPIVEDQLAVRITGEGSQGDAYVDVLPDPGFGDPEEERFGRLRGKLLYEPEQIDGLRLLLSADYLDNERPLQGFVTDVGDLVIDDSFPFFLRSSYEEVEQLTLQARAEYEINEHFALFTRVAYLDNQLRFVDTQESVTLDTPFGPFPIVSGETGFDKSQIEVEGYLQVRDIGVLRRGVIGVIHNREEEDGFGTNAFDFLVEGEIENTGIYGEAELAADALVPGLSLIAGGRLEIDSRFRDAEAPTGNPASSASFDETVFLPKIGLRYDLDDVSTVGYTYSRGFRNGGVDVDLGASLQGAPFVATATFEPEYIDQHEIYARTSLLDNRLDLSVTAFYYTWEDAQVPGASDVIDSSGVRLFGNIPKAVGFGGELGAAFQVTPKWRVSGALGLLETDIKDAGLNLAELEGGELPRAPNITASAALTWMPTDGFDATVSVRHVGSTASALGQADLDSYTVVDIDAGYEFDLGGTDLRVDAFIKNVFDERYATFEEDISPLFGGGSLSAAGRPRTFGVALTARF
ncbi:MAG: TonB-dependent receptor [Pseudomonadota bacterium]